MEWKYVTKNNFFDSIRNEVWKTFIDSVLGAGLSIRNRWNNGFTVLSFAAEYGDVKVVEYLVQKGADYNAKNGAGTLPLHIAAKHSHQDVVEFLINLGVCVDSRDKNNRTPLHYVAETFHRQMVQRRLPGICPASDLHFEISYYILANGANPNAIDNRGDVPLLVAAKYSCIHVVEILIMWGANVECHDGQKWTVLHYASLNGWLDVVHSLVEKVSNVNAKTSSGDTPITLAIQNSHRNVFDLLVKSRADLECHNNNRMTLLHLACRIGWMDIAQMLVKQGLNINAETSTGDTPLLIAANNLHKEIVLMLFISGAQLKCCNSKKWTLLHYACEAGWLYIVRYLVKAELDINAKTRDYETPLFIAAKCSHMEIFHYLLHAEADVNIKILIKPYDERVYYGDRSDEAWTLLSHACYKGWLKVVLCLIQKGINVNEKSFGGDTPLHLAVKGENLEIVKILLEACADCNIINEENKTAFFYLILNDHLSNAETIRLFLEYGLYINSFDYKNLSNFPFFKDKILQDAKLCTQSVVNRFNIELKELYEEPIFVEYLPPFERMKMKSNRNMAYCIEQSVRHEIETNGYCNVLEVRPIVLSVLCVSVLSDYI